MDFLNLFGTLVSFQLFGVNLHSPDARRDTAAFVVDLAQIVHSRVRKQEHKDCTERITAADAARTRSRKSQIHRDLVAQAEALLALAKRCDSRPNKDNAKFTAQIRSLVEKWKI